MIKMSESRNLTHYLVNELGSAIVKGDYSIEDGLPSEAEICERYEISRTATREAVKMLSAKGLIVSRPKKGITIQAKEKWNMFDTDVLNWILMSTPSLESLRDFTQLRLAIEPEAASLAAKTANESDIKRIETALFRMRKAEEGLDDALDADIEFHSSLLLASQNPFFIQLRSFIETALRVSIRFTNQLKGVPTANFSDHNAIFLAVVARDPEKAHAASRKILIEALDLIEHQL
ncbi:FadR/GntR family transcriptional regulator [Aliikangiella coralliicola]|uniref:FadR family transcriptional regulator n=1 Tax=Aliikangiella coralliicola TaxID=2592383 RepID=A0A545UIC6_9GAMM|nr:FadR/GntR family transcriptional regulator [Aliikangiella coralliicola]TQV89221.1 FadR family transcriptional regulator [Aliikangiella coralliicola]